MNQVLSYREFFYSFQEEVKSQLPSDMSLRALTKTGSNGMQRDGVEIIREGEPFGRVFYPEDYYPSYLQGEPPAQLAGLVITTCLEGDGPPDAFFQIKDYEEIKDRLTLQLVNYERNAKMLEECVHIGILDLAMVCRITFPVGGGHIYSTLVTKEMWQDWEIPEKDIFLQAGVNMLQNNLPVVHPLHRILAEQKGGGNPETDPEPELYVLTTQAGVYGACAFVISEAVSHLAEQLERDILILPSSMHEVLLMPDWGEVKVAQLQKVVSDINRTVVTPEDFLSDHVYRYRLQEGDFVIDH